MGVVEVVDVEENGWKVRSLVGYQVEVLRTQNMDMVDNVVTEWEPPVWPS